MLVLTRQADEDVWIGPDVRVRVLSVQGNQVRLGIEAPRSVAIHRGELLEAVQSANEAALQQDESALQGLKRAVRLAKSAE